MMIEERQKHTITKADCVLIGMLVVVAGAMLLIMCINRTPGMYADIMVDGTSVKTLSLENDTSFLVKQESGNNTIVIKDGTVRVENADCPDKICVKHKEIKNVGETIICLPHKMVVEIKQEK